MAILAESLVEEWLNRDRFFTIRGAKHGVSEMDILAVRREPDGKVIGVHVEVQVSFRPIGYICLLTDDLAGQSNLKKTSAKRRTEQEVTQCVDAWIEKKFLAKKKAVARDNIWPGLDWRFSFVHGVVKEEKELDLIRSRNVNVIPFKQVLVELCHTGEHTFSGSAGGDLAEIVRYYRDNCPLDEYK
ncbi:MAG: hypothetical protein MUF81_03750 [Verrucomicrobia bacterium]|jgi:hypothetical protein|nr:hypothetical protein [Verrucomicrobiota bacterium]